MSTIIAVAVGAVTGSLITAFVFTIFEDSAPALFGRAVGTVIRPVMPTWFWVRYLRTGSPYQTFAADSVEHFAVRDGDSWLSVFDDRDRRVGFSPLMLLPAGATRMIVRVAGRPVALRHRRDADDGMVVRALTIAPGVRIARRRSEDLKYLAAHGRYPTVTLPSP